MIEVIASANVNPTAAPGEDVVVDLAINPLGSLPVLRVYAQATDTDNPGASFSYQWTIVGAPEGSVATLATPSADSTTIEGVDRWGNLLLHCVATNTATGKTSRQLDPDDASAVLPNQRLPWSQFVVVRLKEPNHGLEAPAPGERNTLAALRAHLDVLASVGEAVGLDLADLDDVAPTSTGPKLDQLLGGGYATYGGDMLHLHKGSQVDVATQALQGVVRLSDAPADGVNPRALNRAPVVLSGRCDVSYRQQGPELVILPNADGSPHLLWRLDSDLVLVRWVVHLRDGGQAGVQYSARLVQGQAADVLAGSTSLLSGPLQGAPAGDGQGLILDSGEVAVAVGAGVWIGLDVQGGTELMPGRGLSSTLWLQKRV